MQHPHAILPIHQDKRQDNTHTPRSKKTLVILFGGLLLWCFSLVWGHAEILPPQRIEAQRRAESLLRALQAQEYAEVIQQLDPSLRRTLTVEQLGEYIERIFRITGPYKPNSLQLQSVHKEGQQLRFVWRAQCKQDRPQMIVLFHPTSWQIRGFVLQSPRIQQRMRQEVAQPHPTGDLRQVLDKAVDQLMQGYNQNNWAIFSQPCGDVLRLTLRPPQFAFLRGALFSRFGAYQTRQLWSTHRLQPEGHLILRYRATFTKQASLVLQVIFAKQQGRDVIQWWQLRPLPASSKH